MPKALAVFPATKDIRIVDHPAARAASPTDVTVRILEVGVCGTDREIAAFEYGTPPSGSDYLVIGHESLGEVIDIGPSVTRVKKGDLVVTMVRRPCNDPSCLACRAGRQDFCYTGNFTERGIKQQHGFMTASIVDDERYMNVVPRELREIAVLTEPLTIAEKAIEQIWQVQQRLPWACPTTDAGPGTCHNALVLGAGPVGLLGAMALKAAGFNVFVYSRSPVPIPKADLTSSIGATYISSEQVPVDDLPTRIGNIDAVYEAVGASSLAFDVLRVLGTNGVFVFTGVPGRKAPISVDTDLLMRNLVLKNQVVFGSVNAGRNAYESAIRDLSLFMHKWPAAVRALITGRYPIEQARDLLLSKGAGIKEVVQIA
jgi:threonine dehydrogenase-like Zn-dependent dehydrogenase